MSAKMPATDIPIVSACHAARTPLIHDRSSSSSIKARITHRVRGQNRRELAFNALLYHGAVLLGRHKRKCTRMAPLSIPDCFEAGKMGRAVDAMQFQRTSVFSQGRYSPGALGDRTFACDGFRLQGKNRLRPASRALAVVRLFRGPSP